MNKSKCWRCLGTGRVIGPLHDAACPNPHCPHVQTRRVAREILTPLYRTLWRLAAAGGGV
jgi:hypothetical protein